MASVNRVALKVRGYLFNKLNNAPVEGCVVALSVKLSETVTKTVRTLSTDENGYFSFDISNLESEMEFIQKIAVQVISQGVSLDSNQNTEVWSNDTKIPFKSNTSFFSMTNSFFVEVKNSFVPNKTLESIQNPDQIDREILNKVATKRAKAASGGDCCDGLLPSDLSPREFYFNKADFSLMTTYKLHEKYPNGIYEGNVTGELVEDAIRNSFGILAEVAQRFQAESDPIAKAEILREAWTVLQTFFRGSKNKALMILKEYRQSWIPEGMSLGDIAYSLALAPGESVDLAVIDWARSDRDSRGENISYSENLSHSQMHNRDIEETVRATLSEFQSGYSDATTFGGGVNAQATIPIEGIPIGIGLGLNGQSGNAKSLSYGTRNLTGSDVQKIADSVVQNSSFNRNMNSTVIVQSKQAVNNTLKTRTISNNNHCHALTVQYFEVNRNYKVVTEKVGDRLALGVKIKTKNEDGTLIEFKEADLLNYYHIFKPLFTGTIYEDGIKNIYNHKIGTRITQAPWKGDNIVTNIKATITVDSNEGGVEADKSVNLRVHLVNGSIISIPISGDFDVNKVVSGEAAMNVPRHEIIALSLENKMTSWAGEENWNMKSLTVSYISRNHQTGRTLESKTLGAHSSYKFTMHHTIPVTITDSIGERPLPVEEVLSESDKTAGKLRIELLLNHMNDRFLTYRKYLLANLDFDSIWKFLDVPDFTFPEIEHRLAGFLGEFAVFPINMTMDMIFGDDYIMGAEKAETRYIGLPTRGVFAETMLSNCSACEKRDVTRYWDWTESPIKNPTPINAISQGDYTKEVNTNPSQLPSPVLNIVNAPSIPDPSGLANALAILGKGDAFRDMSGLSDLMKLNQAGLEKEIPQPPTPITNQKPKDVVDKATAAEHLVNKSGVSEKEKPALFKKVVGIEDKDEPFVGTVNVRFKCENIENFPLDGALVAHFVYGNEPEVSFIMDVRNGLARGQINVGPLKDGDTISVHELRLTVKNDSSVTGTKLAKILLRGSEDFIYKKGVDWVFVVQPNYVSEEITAANKQEAQHKFSYAPELGFEVEIPDVLKVGVTEKGIGYDYTNTNANSTEKKFMTHRPLLRVANDNINDLIGGVNITSHTLTKAP